MTLKNPSQLNSSLIVHIYAEIFFLGTLIQIVNITFWLLYFPALNYSGKGVQGQTDQVFLFLL